MSKPEVAKVENLSCKNDEKCTTCIHSLSLPLSLSLSLFLFVYSVELIRFSSSRTCIHHCLQGCNVRPAKTAQAGQRLHFPPEEPAESRDTYRVSLEESDQKSRKCCAPAYLILLIITTCIYINYIQNLYQNITYTRVLQKVLSPGSDYCSATFYQTYFLLQTFKVFPLY